MAVCTLEVFMSSDCPVMLAAAEVIPLDAYPKFLLVRGSVEERAEVADYARTVVEEDFTAG